jgi:hypothetical protein
LKAFYVSRPTNLVVQRTKKETLKMLQKQASSLYFRPWRTLGLTVTAFAFGVLMLGSSSATAQSKPTLTGLVAMGEINGTTTAGWEPDNGIEEPLAHLNTYNAVDINVTWAQLEPSLGTFDFSAIDGTGSYAGTGLAAITAYNTAHPTRPMKAKLRVYGGVNVPSFILDGCSSHTGPTYCGPVALDDSGTTIYMGLFWTYEYHQAWLGLQNALANAYDGNSQIAEVSVGSCASLSGEPMVLPIHNDTSLTNLHALGYSDTQMKACLDYAASNASTGDYHSWVKTPKYFAFSEYDDSDGATGTGGESPDFPFTSSVMSAFRTSYSSGAVLGNNALQDPLASSETGVYNGETDSGTFYDGLKQFGAPIGFQAVSGSPSGGWSDIVSIARNTYSATEMEIWQTTAAVNKDGKKGFASITQSQLTTWAGYAW